MEDKKEHIEIALCELYIKQRKNQAIEIDYTNKRDSLKSRIRNLNNQYLPLDIVYLCEKHGYM